MKLIITLTHFHIKPADLIVASAGDDKKISLWHKKGQNVGQLPTSTVDRGDDIEVSVHSYDFVLTSLTVDTCAVVIFK